MENQLRILILEDSPADAELEQYELKKAGFSFTSIVVETREDFARELDHFKPDIILSDYNLEGFNGREALHYARNTHPEVPVVIVTGMLGDEAAVELVREGAKDYVLKDKLLRLGPAVERALSIEQGIRARKAAERTLHQTFDRIQTQLQAVGIVAMSEALITGKFEQFARELSELAARTSGAEHIAIWLFNEDESELRCIDLYEATPARHSCNGILLRSQYENEIQSIISEKYVNADEPLTDPRTAGYAEDYLKPRHVTSMLDVLIHVSGHNLGLLRFAHGGKPHHWEQDEITFATQLADMLALALINWQRMQMQEQLRENLVDTIRAFALTVEKRDPYTAGHQQRVAELCVAIGRDLGLTEDRLEGLRLGASIHDIGKIYIPAEILNRPGKLTEAEFEIIKTHPQAGYDIVKDVKFPWPVAETILQHHERLDGSGYPRGLKGEQIILEARILTVADVMEAVSSHRPYRPALGIEVALKEIEANMGKLYDQEVAKACIKLFREKGYAFPAANNSSL